MKPNLLPGIVVSLLATQLIHRAVTADSVIGVNFAGGNVSGTPTLLDRSEVAGVVPQSDWNNFAAYEVTGLLLRDDTPKATAITLAYSTGEMYGSGAFNSAAGITNGNAKLLNGYLNALDNDTNTVTFAGLSPATRYTVIVYTLRDESDEEAIYWVNDDSNTGPYIACEGALDWLLNPQFRRATNVFGSPDLGNYVRLDDVTPRPDGSLSVSVASAFHRGPINGIQLISPDPFPPATTPVAINLQPRNVSVSPGESGTFRVVANGPWDYQWHSNNVAIPGAISDSYTTTPLTDELGTRVQYHVVVSNGDDQVISDSVHLISVPALPPGGIFYDAFNYPPGPLGNWGEWTLENTARVVSPGLTYTDGTHWLEVSGNAMVPPIDWDPFENIPIKVFGDQTYGGPNSTVYMSFLFDFRNLNPTNNAGYVGVSGFEGSGGWGAERFFVGKTWYGDFLTVDGRISDSTIPYHTNGFLVLRLTQNDAQGTYELFLNPPLSGLPDVPDANGTVDFLVTFNAVGVNAGEWAGEKGNHNVPFADPGPLVDEFRFGLNYAAVAPIAVPTLTVALNESGVSVGWSPDLPGFSLQVSDSLSAPNWNSAPDGNPVVIPVDHTERYFRLTYE
jgi:hypothetical protein